MPDQIIWFVGTLILRFIGLKLLDYIATNRLADIKREDPTFSPVDVTMSKTSYEKRDITASLDSHSH